MMCPSVDHALFEGDQGEFIAVCYLGGGRKGDWLDRCVQRAYLDMSRTLHGMAAFSRTHPGWQTSMKQLLKQRLCLLSQSAALDQEGFDSWHKACVAALQSLSNSLGYASDDGSSGRHFTVGQAQKWINMSIKYAIALGEARVPGFRAVFPVAHAPLDSLVLSSLKDSARVSWSRIDDYQQYMELEESLRQGDPGRTPLDIENQKWLAAMGRAD